MLSIDNVKAGVWLRFELEGKESLMMITEIVKIIPVFGGGFTPLEKQYWLVRVYDTFMNKQMVLNPDVLDCCTRVAVSPEEWNTGGNL